MVAIELSDHGNDSRASFELDSGLLQNWCLCAQILELTLQVRLRAFKSLHWYFQKNHLIMWLVEAMLLDVVH